MSYSASGLIGLGLFFLGDAIYDQHRGIAEAYAPSGHLPRHEVAHRQNDPRGFEGLMQYQWLRATVVLGAGLVLLGIYRRLDRSDPFHPEFRGNAAFDELDKKLTDESDKFHQPLR